MKEKILLKLLKIFNERINLARVAYESAKESRDNETKSSVGDKYETGRTLMQQEVEKYRIQLQNTEVLKTEIQKITPNKKSLHVEFGSFVITAENNYFISIAIGELKTDFGSCYCISLASPIGKLLHGKKEGDKFMFRGKEIIIEQLL